MVANWKMAPRKDEHFYAKALKPYKDAVDSARRNNTHRTNQKCAADVARSHDIDYRKFLQFLKKAAEKKLIDKKYVIEELDNFEPINEGKSFRIDNLKQRPDIDSILAHYPHDLGKDLETVTMDIDAYNKFMSELKRKRKKI